MYNMRAYALNLDGRCIAVRVGYAKLFSFLTGLYGNRCQIHNQVIVVFFVILGIQCTGPVDPFTISSGVITYSASSGNRPLR